MRFLKYLLLPIQILYSIIIHVRNTLYNYKILKSHNSKPIIISVGNLITGGSGKTPMVEYIIRRLKDEKIAVLSRGYKRETKGFILVNQQHSSKEVGDENRQLYNKFSNSIIACDNNRVNGIKQLIKKNEKLDFIILDDGFQHRRVQRDIDMLLTEYDNLFIYDQLIPVGNLREHKKEMKRANIIAITKCPNNLSDKEKNDLIKNIKPKPHQKVYFSYIKDYKYIEMISFKEININKNEIHLLLTGISNPKTLLNHLKSSEINFHHLKFKDHHHFRDSDISKIIKLKKSKNLLLTEKDYYRLSENHKKILAQKFNIICIQIEIDFMQSCKDNFNNQLLNFEKSKKI